MRNPCPPPAQLLSWLDGLAPPDEAERTAVHASGCTTCAERISMMRSTLHGRPPQTVLESGFAATVRQNSKPVLPPVPPAAPPAPSPAAPASVRAPGLEQAPVLPTAPASLPPLGLDMAPTTPFLRAVPVEESVEGTGGGSRNPTRDLRGPGKDPVRQADALAPGDTLGRFVVLARQGSGGMGVVYAAYDPELDRKVALKILRSDYDRSLTAELRTRLLREAQAMARLSHPNVIPVYDVGTVGVQVFLAMEFVDGTTLTKHQRSIDKADRGRWRAILSLYLQAGRGLAAAHAAGLIHRDFKPDNVLVSKEGNQVRVVDFGLARPEAMGAESELSPLPLPPPSPPLPPSPPRPEGPSEGRQPGSKPVLETPLTQSGMLVGTPAYMSPEQLGGRAVDARTDQFSFCVALWEALLGERPFKGASAMEIAHAIETGKPTGPANAKVPSWLRKILVRGLAADPDRRYPSMDALLSDLSRDPAVVQRRAMMAAGVLLVVGASVGGAAYASRRARTLCTGAEARLAGVWDAKRKAMIKGAVMGTQLPYATPVWASTEPVVDAYAARWVQQRTEVCEATRVRGDQSEQLLDLRVRCLDRRLEEVNAFLSLMEAGDAKVIEQALQAAQAFTDPRTCQSAMAMMEEVPESPEARASAEAARKAMAKAKALGDAAAPTKALQEAASAVGDARKSGHQATLAEALVALGDLEDRTGDREKALAHLREAAWVADKAQQDTVRAKALIGVALAALQLGRAEDAVAWGQSANAALQRAGGDDALQARLHHVLALALQALGRSDEAVAHFTLCLDLRKKAFGADAVVVAASMQAFGATLREQGQLEQALVQLKKAVAMKEQSLGASHPEVGLARQALGSALRAKGELKPALEEQRAAAEILSRAGADPLALARLSSETAQTLREVGKAAEALAEQRAALSRLEAAVGKEHPLVADALLDLAELQIDSGRAREALAPIARAERLNERGAGTDSPRRARAAINLGRAHLALGRAGPALSLAKTVRERLERGGGPPSLVLQAAFLGVQAQWAKGQRAAALAEGRRVQEKIVPLAPADPAAEALKNWLAARGRG